MYSSEDNGVHYLNCTTCGHRVSTGFAPLLAKDNSLHGFVLRAAVTCPECLEKEVTVATEPAKLGRKESE